MMIIWTIFFDNYNYFYNEEGDWKERDWKTFVLFVLFCFFHGRFETIHDLISIVAFTIPSLYKGE